MTSPLPSASPPPTQPSPPAPSAPAHEHALAYAEDDLGETPAAGFSQQPSPDGRAVVVEGTCPRCHGHTVTRFPLGLPGTGTKGLFDVLTGRGAAAADEDPLAGEVHFCECGHAHPQLPADAVFVGCGASWRIKP
ncbi:hypothetical protein [Kitasatospora sp. NPDC047058]|uniref:hypothetical protein n=1 Tax=Kitasatospora sp. NPDC047058 TaxID=3155620 RepID=UPI0033F27BCF